MARNRFRVAVEASRDDDGSLTRQYVVLDLGEPGEDGYVHDDTAERVGKPYADTPEGKGKAAAAALELNTRTQREDA